MSWSMLSDALDRRHESRADETKELVRKTMGSVAGAVTTLCTGSPVKGAAAEVAVTVASEKSDRVVKGGCDTLDCLTFGLGTVILDALLQKKG